MRKASSKAMAAPRLWPVTMIEAFRYLFWALRTCSSTSSALSNHAPWNPSMIAASESMKLRRSSSGCWVTLKIFSMLAFEESLVPAPDMSYNKDRYMKQLTDPGVTQLSQVRDYKRHMLVVHWFFHYLSKELGHPSRNWIQHVETDSICRVFVSCGIIWVSVRTHLLQKEQDRNNHLWRFSRQSWQEGYYFEGTSYTSKMD